MPKSRDPDTLEIILGTAIGSGIAIEVSFLGDLPWMYYGILGAMLIANWFLGPFVEALAQDIRWRR
jgi:hypothetical protein